VVTAVGVRPEVGWLAGSGVLLENGVAVDEGLRASVPGVFAAGDCAAFWSRRFGGRIRVEHWDSAIHAPEVVAANILGGGEPYDPVPYFWSEQFGRMVQYCGHHAGADRLVWRGDPEGRDWTVCWLAGAGPDGAGERLAAVLAVGRATCCGGAVDRIRNPGGPRASLPVPLRAAPVEGTPRPGLELQLCGDLPGFGCAGGGIDWHTTPGRLCRRHCLSLAEVADRPASRPARIKQLAATANGAVRRTARGRAAAFLDGEHILKGCTARSPSVRLWLMSRR
jgi:hypothetical protein